MIIKKLLSISLAFCLAALGLFSAETLPYIPKDYKVTFLLPINWGPSSTQQGSTANQCNLSVTIPEGYQAIQPQSSWENVSLIEFIPKGETADHWSETISIHKIIGKRLQADQIVDFLKKNIIANTQQPKELFYKVSKEPKYLFAKLGLSYILKNTREVLVCRYYSGPSDCVGIQYTIRPKKEESTESVVKKIEHFFDTNTQLMNCDKPQQDGQNKQNKLMSL